MDLIDGHLYTQFLGMYLFRAIKTPGATLGWVLFRLNPEGGDPWPAKQGDLIGYMQTEDGVWWRLEGGDPAVNNGRGKVGRAYFPLKLNPEFWEHAGESPNDYDLNEMLRHVNL